MYQSFVSGYANELKDVDIDVHLLPKEYGGPTALKKYRALIDVPYQTSTMKMYENLAAGVVTLVPTPAYLEKLVALKGKYGFGFHYIEDAVEKNGGNWSDYFEYYSKDLKEFYYQFDSVDELKLLLKKPVLDDRGVSEKMVVAWGKIQEESLRKWKELLLLLLLD
jgi:hypothetical protein